MSKTEMVALDSEEDFDMFGELPPSDPFEIKKIELAANLAALLSFKGITRSKLAEILNWKKSRVTTVLSGNSNATLKTIWDVCLAAGYDFDVVFKLAHEKCLDQPWHKHEREQLLWSRASVLDCQTLHKPVMSFAIQTQREVEYDIRHGKAKSHYISVIQNDQRDTQKPKASFLSKNDRTTPKLFQHGNAINIESIDCIEVNR